MIGGSSEELSDEDDELCPVNCVREFKNDNDFLRILEKAKETKSLVVVDFYSTAACGSCKYIDQGFTKLCKGHGVEENGLILLKHNVSTALADNEYPFWSFMFLECVLVLTESRFQRLQVIDEYDEQPEVA